jgi:hypothetical protein
MKTGNPAITIKANPKFISKNRTIIAVITIAAVRKIAAGITQGFPDQTTTP